MGGMLSGTAPLRGRAGLELRVAPLDYRLAAQFWNLDDSRLAVLVHAIAGRDTGLPSRIRPRRRLLARRDVDAAGAKLLCASGAGFAPELHAAADADGVILLDFEWLYHGA